jgi:hypothetical protein
MMVAVFYDWERQQTVVWTLLGWSERHVSVASEQSPSITVRSESGEDITTRYEADTPPRVSPSPRPWCWS